MKSIKFTDQELEFLKTQYQLELVEAEKYVEDVKNLLVKLGVKPVSSESVPATKTKRGRKKAETPKETTIKKSKRGRKPKGTVQSETIEPKIEKTVKTENKTKTSQVKKSELNPRVEKVQPPEKKKPHPKPKTKRKAYKRRGIVLKNLSKPLPKKDVLPETETTPVESPKA